MSQIFIGGVYRDAQTSEFRDVKNPANSRLLGVVPAGTLADLELGADAARKALPAWAALNEDDRYTALQGVARAVTAMRERLVELLVAESGLTQGEARSSIDASLLALEYPAAYRRAAEGRVRAVFGPASSPILPIIRQVTSALMAGDTVVLVPPVGAALVNLALAQAWAVLPEGVVNVITGDAALAQALAAHRHIEAVSFTGSAGVATAIAAIGRPLSAVVGKLDAAIVRADADLDLAVRAIAWSRLRHGGRACVSSRRIYVDASIAQDFVVRMHEYVGLLEVDDPVRESSILGPLGSVEAAKRCENQVVKSMREGARLVLGGFRFRPSGLQGHWLQPTILADIRAEAIPMREEIAGPVITIAPYRDEGELLASLRHVPGPVGVSLYGADDDALCAFAAPVEASAIWINLPQSDYAPPEAVIGQRPTYRPAYAANVLPDFYVLDPLRVWSLT